MLPGGTARGGYSLGALYAEASGGGGFDNAHDALADARALTTVWRWLSSVEMGIAAPGAADEQARTRCFQAELQSLGYEATAPSKPRAARGGAAAAAATPSKAKAAREKANAAMEKAAAAPPLSGTAPLLEVPGVSDFPLPCYSPLPSYCPEGGALPLLPNMPLTLQPCLTLLPRLTMPPPFRWGLPPPSGSRRAAWRQWTSYCALPRGTSPRATPRRRYAVRRHQALVTRQQAAGSSSRQ